MGVDGDEGCGETGEELVEAPGVLLDLGGDDNDDGDPRGDDLSERAVAAGFPNLVMVGPSDIALILFIFLRTTNQLRL